MDLTSLYSFMSKYRYGVVSSTSSVGNSQSALVGIATTPDLEIVFDTVTSSRKFLNLIERPHCFFVVGWGTEQTVQFEGTAILPEGPDLLRYQEAYFAVWPECRIHINWPDIAYFVVRPVWIRFSDYDKSPPLIEETIFQTFN